MGIYANTATQASGTRPRSRLYPKWVLLQAIIHDPNLLPSTAKVAASLLDHHNVKTGRCDPSEKTIAKKLGLSVDTIKRAVRELVARDWVRTKRRYNNSSRYSFNWEKAGTVDPLTVDYAAFTPDAAEPAPAEVSLAERFKRVAAFIRDVSASGFFTDQDEFERRRPDLTRHVNEVVAPDIRLLKGRADEQDVAAFVDALVNAHPKSKKQHESFRSSAPETVRERRPTKWALEAALQRLFKNSNGFLPSADAIGRALYDAEAQLDRLNRDWRGVSSRYEDAKRRFAGEGEARDGACEGDEPDECGEEDGRRGEGYEEVPHSGTEYGVGRYM